MLIAAFSSSGLFAFLAGSAFVLFWALCLTGVAKANNLAVHQPLLADNYPIGIRARMSAAMNIGQQVLGNLSPVVVGAIATWAGGVEGWFSNPWKADGAVPLLSVFSLDHREPQNVTVPPRVALLSPTTKLPPAE